MMLPWTSNGRGRRSLRAVVGSTDGVEAWTYWDSREGHQVAVHGQVGHKVGARDAWVEVDVEVGIASEEEDLMDTAAVDSHLLELVGGIHWAEVLVVADVGNRSVLLQACLTEISAKTKTLFANDPL